MNRLKEILSLLADKEAEVKINPEDTNPNVRAGVEALVRNAKQEIPGIAMQYKDEVMNSVVLIAVSGEGCREFAEIAAKDCGTVSVDFQGVTKKLVERLKARYASDTYNQGTHFILLDEFQKLKLEYEILRIAAPQVSGYNDGIYDFPLEEAVDKLLIKNYGDKLFSAISRREIGEQALNGKFNGKKLPVVLYNYTGSVDTDSLPLPLVTLAIDSKVTLKSVKKALTEVSSKLNKQMPEQKDPIQDQEDDGLTEENV